MIGDGGDVSEVSLMVLAVMSATAEKKTATEANIGVDVIVKIMIGHHH